MASSMGLFRISFNIWHDYGEGKLTNPTSVINCQFVPLKSIGMDRINQNYDSNKHNNV